MCGGEFEMRQRIAGKKSTTRFDLKRLVTSKINDGDVKGAVRIMSLDDAVAGYDENTAEVLRSKHPAGNENADFPGRTDIRVRG